MSAYSPYALNLKHYHAILFYRTSTAQFEQGSLFVCCVFHVEISQTTMAFAVLLVCWKALDELGCTELVP
jgi:hypothetical protein